MSNDDLLAYTSAEQEPNDNVSMMPTAMKYGIGGGLILVLTSFIMYNMGSIDSAIEAIKQAADNGEQPSTSNWVETLIFLVVLLGAIIGAISFHKNKELYGQISLGRCIGLGALTSAFMGLCTALWTYILFAFLAPEFLDTMLEITLAQAEAQAQDEDALEMTRGIMEMIMSPLVMAISSFFYPLVVGTIISLIAGLFMKTK